MRWIGANGEVIQTLDGIIVSIGGFGPSFEILNVMDLSLLVKKTHHIRSIFIIHNFSMLKLIHTLAIILQRILSRLTRADFELVKER